MSATCAFDTGFDSGFEICTPVVDAGTPDTRYLRGVPAATPRIRKRPEIREIAGVGYVAVLGAGTIAGEARLAGNLEQRTEGTGHLVRETWRILVGAIRSGMEVVLAGDGGLAATAVVAHAADVRAACDLALSAVGVIRTDARGAMTTDIMAKGRMPVRVGAEAVLTAQESEEAIVLAASTMIVRRLTRSR